MRSNLMKNYMGSMAVGQEESVNDIITQLYRVERKGTVKLTERQIYFLIEEAKKVMLKQPTLLELECPVNVCGDIHGQYADLVEIFKDIGYPPNRNYLFLGNYVDRGENQVECVCLLLAYKVKYPENFFLLRGNHETEDVNRIHGFFDECKRKFSVEIWKQFNDTFNCLPLAAVIEDKIFCCHGGPSPDLYSFKQILRTRRPVKVPETGLICHLLWAEPDEDVETWGESFGSTGITFGKKALYKFLRHHNLDLVVRSQLVQDGYEFFSDKKLVTIFSASNFAGEFENAAAVMSVDEDLEISFRVLVKLNSNQEIITANQLDQISGETIIKPFYKSRTVFIKEKGKRTESRGSRIVPASEQVPAVGTSANTS